MLLLLLTLSKFSNVLNSEALSKLGQASETDIYHRGQTYESRNFAFLNSAAIYIFEQQAAIKSLKPKETKSSHVV